MLLLLNFVIGLIFGLGLLVAGMANPAKVLNFLDVAAIPAGRWDPSLAFVLAGAIAVTVLGYRLVLRRPRPYLADRFHLPAVAPLDRRIVVGPALFGIGWGLAGFCPGPAFTTLGTGSAAGALFVAAMLAGMLTARALAGARTAQPARG
jgi:uncharacterized membrane protein YedE/YeeE